MESLQPILEHEDLPRAGHAGSQRVPWPSLNVRVSQLTQRGSLGGPPSESPPLEDRLMQEILQSGLGGEDRKTFGEPSLWIPLSPPEARG